MKVLFLSNHRPDYTTTNYYREKAVRELGHELVFCEAQGYRVPRRLRETFTFLLRGEMARVNRDILDVVDKERPDICLVVGGTELLPETVRKIRARNIPVLLWTTDPPQRKYFHWIEAAAPEYTKVFCAGTEAIELLRPRGVEALWLPFACDPELHCPVDLTTEERLRLAREVSFVGSWYPHRRDIFETLTSFDLGIWGPLWRRAGEQSPLQPFIDDRRIEREEWVRIYSAADIVPVVHYQDGVTPCHQASPKLFEAMACGAFVLCDNQKDAKTLFQDGQHLVFFHDTKDLAEKVRYYLDRPEERRRIATAGRECVLQNHTWRQRMERILIAGKELS